jgi:hypothetical protein
MRIALSIAALAIVGSAATLTKHQVLDRWATALGGRDKLESIRSIHSTGLVETGGMKGTFERWATSRGEFRLALDINGAIRQVTIFDGKQGWAMDTSGASHELSGGNLRSAISSAYESSDSFLFPGRLPGVVQYRGMDAQQTMHVLRLEPDGGNPVTVYLDAQTFLPAREESAGPLGNNRTVTFADWHDVSGIKMPGRTIQSTGDPKFDVAVTIEHVDVNTPLDAQLFTKPQWPAAAVRFAKDSRRSVIPIEIYEQRVLVPVRVNGGEAAGFVMDSGAGTSVIVKPYADRIGLKSEGALRAAGAAGTTSLALAKNVLFSLQGVEFPMSSITVVDASAGLPLGTRSEGLLGYDVLSRVVARIDYEHKQLTLYDPADYVAPQQAAVLPLSFLGNWPIVSGKIILPGRQPIQSTFFIDTGAAGLMLSTPFTNTNHAMDAVADKVEGVIYGAGGESKRFSGHISGIELGGYLVAEPVAGFSADTKEGALASQDIGAIVGGEILRRFIVTFDYPHTRILLEPSGSFTNPKQ